MDFWELQLWWRQAKQSNEDDDDGGDGNDENICLHFRAGTSTENLINHQTNETQQKMINGNTYNITEHNMHLYALTFVTV